MDDIDNNTGEGTGGPDAPLYTYLSWSQVMYDAWNRMYGTFQNILLPIP